MSKLRIETFGSEDQFHLFIIYLYCSVCVCVCLSLYLSLCIHVRRCWECSEFLCYSLDLMYPKVKKLKIFSWFWESS